MYSSMPAYLISLHGSFGSIGLDASHFHETHAGMAALEQTIQYKAELRAGDVFEIHSSILEVREKTLRLRHEMYNSGTRTLAACTTIVGVHLDMNTRRGSPLPEPVRQRALRTVFGIRHRRSGDEQS